MYINGKLGQGKLGRISEYLSLIDYQFSDPIGSQDCEFREETLLWPRV